MKYLKHIRYKINGSLFETLQSQNWKEIKEANKICKKIESHGLHWILKHFEIVQNFF